MKSGKYFSTNISAADIFWLVQHRVPQSEWAAILARSYEKFDGAGISEFITLAISEEIFAVAAVESEATDAPALPADHPRGAWIAPHLATFSDLQDLLMIDPIHDTSIEGWPKSNNG